MAAIMMRTVVDHADRGDDRVEREHDVDQHDLQDHRGEGALHRGWLASPSSPSSELVDLVGRLPDQEQAAQDQDQVAPGDLLASTVNRGATSPTIQASTSSSPMRMNIAMNRPMRRAHLALRRRQLVDQDGDEDDVVDAQHQLQRGERGQRDPGLRRSEQFQHDGSPAALMPLTVWHAKRPPVRRPMTARFRFPIMLSSLFPRSAGRTTSPAASSSAPAWRCCTSPPVGSPA